MSIISLLCRSLASSQELCRSLARRSLAPEAEDTMQGGWFRADLHTRSMAQARLGTFPLDSVLPGFLQWFICPPHKLGGYMSLICPCFLESFPPPQTDLGTTFFDTFLVKLAMTSPFRTQKNGSTRSECGGGNFLRNMDKLGSNTVLYVRCYGMSLSNNMLQVQ